MLKPTVKYSSSSQSLLVLSPTHRLSRGGRTWRGTQEEQQRWAVQVWWHKISSRETLQALLIKLIPKWHCNAPLQMPPSAKANAASASEEHFSVRLRIRLEVANVALPCSSPPPPALCFLSEVLESNKRQNRRF